MYAFLILAVHSYEFKHVQMFLSICLFLLFTCLFVHLSVRLCMPRYENVCPSVCSVSCFYASMFVKFKPVSLRASVRVLNCFFWLSFYLIVCPPVSLYVFINLCVCFYLFVYSFICPSVCMQIFVFVSFFILSVCMFAFRFFV